MARTVEVIHMRPLPDADVDEFIREDKNVGDNYTPAQPGFIDRQSARNDEGEWVVIVHWENVESAQASMNLFTKEHPVARRFIELMDPASFSMRRFDVVYDS